jgi:ATP-binding cassette subfamily B protein
MALVEELPSSVEATLKAQRNGSGDEPLTVAVKADITPDGSLGERWVVVDSAHVRVLSPNGDGQAHVDLTLPLSDVNSSRTENLVGGGALLVGRGSDTIELARYTTPLGGRMSSVARTIEALAKGEDLPDLGLDEDDRTCPKCGRPLKKNDDVCRHCFDRRATFGRLLSYGIAYKWQTLTVLVLLLAGTGLSLVPGIIIKNLTDQVFWPREAVPTGERMHRLGVLVAWLVVTQFLGLLVGVARGWISSFLSNSVTLRLRQQVFERLQILGLSYYDKRQTGALMTRVTQDVNELNNFLVDGLQFLVVNGLTVLGVVGILLYHNWRLTLLILIPIPIVVVATRFTWKMLRRRFDRLWHLRSAMNAGLNSALNGARVVKAFAQEDREVDRFNRRAISLYQGTMAVERTYQTVFPAIGFLMGAGQYIVYYVGGRNVVDNVIQLGVLQMFLFYLGQLYGPLQGMTRIADWLGRALTAAERVFEVLDADPDVRDQEDAIALPHVRGEVEFRGVAFGYDKSRRVVEDLSLHVQPGEMIGLVGHSGAGKTTLINLISRFYDPIEGSILIDGVDMRHVRLNDLRSQLGIVLQEPFLFPGTISENIAYAKPSASPEEIMRAAKAANAHDFVMRFPDGYDTQVGERGVKLSGGERQRLSIARAILHDPRILILDEATASVDTETEKQIQEAIGRLIKGRTTFAIAHRLSTLRNADRLVVIDKGKIAEIGTHDELMEKEGGIFRRLVEMQTEINKLRSETAVLAED